MSHSQYQCLILPLTYQSNLLDALIIHWFAKLWQRSPDLSITEWNGFRRRKRERERDAKKIFKFGYHPNVGPRRTASKETIERNVFSHLKISGRFWKSLVKRVGCCTTTGNNQAIYSRLLSVVFTAKLYYGKCDENDLRLGCTWQAQDISINLNFQHVSDGKIERIYKFDAHTTHANKSSFHELLLHILHDTLDTK